MSSSRRRPDWSLRALALGATLIVGGCAGGGGLPIGGGPAAQVSRSLERQEIIPLPVANNQYSSPHFTIVDGSCARMPRLAS